MIEAFLGIDVACAKRKRLPVCLCVREGRRLQVRALKNLRLPKPPAGRGNRAALDPAQARGFALETLDYVRTLEQSLGHRIRTIALDGPRKPSEPGSQRAADRAMSDRGISCFWTPSRQEFDEVREKVEKKLRDGTPFPENSLPRANQLWMLVGFELFSVLAEAGYECREVFPQAIVHRLDCAGPHKSTDAGFSAQLAAAAKWTGTTAQELKQALRNSIYGSRHDRLDAYLCAWVASLPEEQLEACGKPDLDVIWVPKREAPDIPTPLGG